MTQVRFEVGEVISGEAGLTRIVHHKATVAERRRPGRVTARRADGSSIVLDVDEQTSIEGEPVVVMTGPWGELRSHASLAGFVVDAVQAFDVVEIHDVGPAAGMRVGFSGDVVDQAVAEDGGLRDAPSATPIVHATLVATGDAIAKRVKAASTPEPGNTVSPTYSSWIDAQLTATFMVIGLGLLFAITDMTARQLGIVGLACAFALVTVRPHVEPRMWTRTSAFASDPKTSVWLVFGIVLLIGVVALTADKGVLVIWPPAMVVGLAAYAVIGAVFGKTLRLVLRRIARAPVGLGEGTRTIEGTVVGDTVVARATRVSKIRYQSVTVDDVVHVEPFAIVTADGVTVSVAPDQIVWCTTDAATKDISETSTTSEFEETDQIRPGARIAACGRLVKTGDRLELHADGTQPAIVLATGSTEQPLAVAHAAVARRRLDLAVIALAMVAELAVWLVIRS